MTGLMIKLCLTHNHSPTFMWRPLDLLHVRAVLTSAPAPPLVLELDSQVVQPRGWAGRDAQARGLLYEPCPNPTQPNPPSAAHTPSPLPRDALKGAKGGFKSGCKSGYRPLEKRLAGKSWRVPIGWRGVGSGQKRLAELTVTPESPLPPSSATLPFPTVHIRCRHICCCGCPRRCGLRLQLSYSPHSSVMCVMICGNIFKGSMCRAEWAARACSTCSVTGN